MSDSENTNVETVICEAPAGRLRGLVRPDGTKAFLGIRYAMAPRFGPPKPVARWTGELDATAHGPVCPQSPGLMEMTMGGDLAPQSEDCLSLGIFSPVNISGADALPVLVWIHGGAYINGAGSSPWYDGSSLVRRGNVIVVTINYRLGIFGFWRDNNLGLLDQIAALQWIKENISAFGGDPDNVTIFGESAGGSSVIALLASPQTQGLITQAWAMSASIGQYRTVPRANEIASICLLEAGVATDDELQSLSTEKLLEVENKVLTGESTGYDWFAPTWPGVALPGNIVQDAARNAVPLVLGSTRDESRLFGAFSPEAAAMDDTKMRVFISRMLDGHVDLAVDLYHEHRPGENDAQIVMAVQTDEGFRQRAIRLAQMRAVRGNTTWMYWFTYATPVLGGLFGSCHGLDIPFAFDNLAQPGVDFFAGSGDECQLVADNMSTALLGLANNQKASWPAYDATLRSTLRIDSTLQVLIDPEPKIRQLWAVARPDL